uniref:putative PEP-binding protein n=1 Tax=Candidatus Ventrenecus sp. TaxID=3085654 RepID=UPI003FEEFEB6
QDMEFTVQDNKLYLLQTRVGKRTGRAAVKIAVDMVKKGLMSKQEAILSVEAKSLDSFLHKTFDSDVLSKTKPIAHGLAASPGAASGHLYFNAKEAILAHQNGEEVILARSETSPEDIEGMHHANGVLTIHGGMTSHAAVVARGMGTCCVAGCEDIYIDEEKKILITKEGLTLKEKDELSLDGATGLIYQGILPKKDPELTPELQLFMSWADEVKSLKVRVNADTPHDALEAMKFGADGIGLCRTEHMFFETTRIKNFRKMILAQSKEERQKYLKEILPYQEEDFYELFKICNHKAVVIRLLDPPLHEFLPKTDEDKASLASELGISMENLSLRIADLKEFNPMMGHRGCRLLITYPEITVMQTTAIIKSALRLEKENIKVTPEIMIPLVSDVKEFTYVKNVICKTADDLIKEAGSHLKYEVGTMIELPRACLMAGEIAKKANFFSFGTNDLTQMTFGFSRDDAGKFLKCYEENNILKLDPFQKIDENGVGELMKYAIKEARKVKKNMSIGICGEQGGDPQSISFFTSIKASYVSCSLYRVLISRLACAQAALKEKKK